MRLVLSIFQWEFLTSLLGMAVLYLAISGLVWVVIGLILGWGLWFGKPWSPGITWAAAWTYAMYSWFDRLFLTGRIASDSATARQFIPSLSVQQDWPFAAGVTCMMLIFITWVLRSSSTQAYFGTNRERSKDREI